MSTEATVLTGAAFDQVAAQYDADFTDRRLGRWLRARVWATLAAAFAPGQRVLELGCGTGEDAAWLGQRGVHVLATDVSPGMLVVAAAKLARRGLTERVQTAVLDAATLAPTSVQTPTSPYEPFDGVFANFGVLNCIADQRELAARLSPLVRAGGTLVAVVMGPFCLWETLWYTVHGDLQRATRRTRGGTTVHLGEATLPVWYPSPRTLARAFNPHFTLRSCDGLGTLLPPSYLAHLVDRGPNVFAAAARVDGHLPWGAWWADHYIAVFEKRR